MGADGKEDWMQRALAENLLASENVVTDQPSVSDVERTLKSLNGYHDDILQALRNAASHRGLTATPTGSSTVLNDDILMRSLQNYPDFKRSSSQEHVCEGQVSYELSSSKSSSEAQLQCIFSCIKRPRLWIFFVERDVRGICHQKHSSNASFHV